MMTLSIARCEAMIVEAKAVRAFDTTKEICFVMADIVRAANPDPKWSGRNRGPLGAYFHFDDAMDVVADLNLRLTLLEGYNMFDEDDAGNEIEHFHGYAARLWDPETDDTIYCGEGAHTPVAAIVNAILKAAIERGIVK